MSLINPRILLRLTGFITGWLLLGFISCEETFFYTEPILYPAVFIFTGTVTAEDSTPVQGIRILFDTPVSLDTDTVHTDLKGNFKFNREMEYAGPNKLRIRDVDGQNNGGLYQPVDTSFYLTNEQWEDFTVRLVFVLKK